MFHRHIRHQRAEVKDRLKRGSTSLSEVLQEAQTDDVISGMRVSALLESLPGIDKRAARQIMNGLGLAESGLVRELSAEQRAALEDQHGGPMPFQEIEREAAADVERIQQDDKYFGQKGIEDWDEL
jgi:ribosomal protein S13